MIPQETVSQIIETARIEEVVQDFMTLKKRGVNYIGVCPFHQEKTPSFTVSPSKNIYKCFGCGAGGGAVNFVMEHEHMSYPDALKYLANKYNIAYEEKVATPEDIAKQNENEALYVVAGFAQTQFEDQLWNTDEGRSVALSYFKERGFTEVIIKKFGLGYSPNVRQFLVDKAKSQGYQLELLVKTGLIKEKENEYFDFFRDRVIFPIHNLTGKVIAFGARTLKSDKGIPKYLNSPETPIYNKSKTLYGLSQARKSILQHDLCCLVEGYTDVISLHQAGIENVVASAGTSLTVDQIKAIKRFTPNITILYDGDAAGIKASFRGIDLLLQEGMNVKVLLFPDGDDPDSFAKKHAPEDVQSYILTKPQDFLLFKTGILLEESKGDPVKKATLIKEIVNSISLIPDTLTRTVYTKECATHFEIEEQTLVFEVNKLRRNQVKKESGVDSYVPEVKQVVHPLEEVKVIDEMYFQEESVIRLLFEYGDYLIKVAIPTEDGTIEHKVTVGEFVLFQLESDGVVPDNPAFKEIYNSTYKYFVHEGLFPNYLEMLNGPDTELKNVITHFIAHNYTLSENWLNKHKIATKMPVSNIEKDVFKTLYSFKQRKVEQIKSQLQEILKEEYDRDDSEENTKPIMLEIDEYDKLKNLFASKLGRVTIK
ncbi:MAG: DNA primase [Flavobacteriales bacterium]